VIGFDQAQRLATIARFGDDLDPREIVQQRTNPGADEGMIFCEQHASQLHRQRSVIGSQQSALLISG